MDSTVIVAAIGVLGILAGHLATRLGQRAELRQKAVAERAADEHKQFDELKSLLPELREEAERAYAARDRARAEADAEKARRVDSETSKDLALEQYRRTARKALEDLEVLRGLVVTQIMTEASRVEAESNRREHEHPTSVVRPSELPPAPPA